RGRLRAGRGTGRRRPLQRQRLLAPAPVTTPLGGLPADGAVPRHDVPTGGRSGFTVVDDRQVHYLEWGRVRTPNVLCLHGGGQTAYMYEELGASLASKYHVLAPDLPSHGDSDPIDEVGSRHAVA